MAKLSKCESKDSCSKSQNPLSGKYRKKPKIYFCSFDGCKKNYSTTSHLRRHENIHTTGTHKCTEENCGKEFKTRVTLKKHIDNLHLKKYPKKYKCSYCDENFNNHSWFVKHVFRKHTGIKPIVCPKEGCEKRFLFPSRLERHMKVHKDFTCTQENCGKIFSKRLLLSHHIKLCHPIIHKCLECGNIFSNSSNLNAHLNIHKPVREIFQCSKPGCSRYFVKKSNLNHHLRSFHEKRKVCEQKQHYKAFKSQSKLVGKGLSRKRSDIKCLRKSTQNICFDKHKDLIASSSIQPAIKATKAKSNNTVKGIDISLMHVNKSEASHVQKNKTSSTSVSSKIPTVSSEESSEVINNNNFQINIKKDCRWQENTESPVPDECDEIMILPTPPKPQPPVITLDNNGNSAPCLNTRVGPDVCSRDLNLEKATQTVTPLLMSSIIPTCSIVSEELPGLLQNVIQNNPNGIVVQVVLPTN